MPDNGQQIIDALRRGLRWAAMRKPLVVALIIAAITVPTVAALYLGSRAHAHVVGLTTLLGDESAEVRSAAAVALIRLGERAIPAVCDCLRQHDDDDVRKAAARILSSIGKPAVPALTECLSDGDEGVRVHAAEALGDIGPAAADAVPELSTLLRDQSPKVRSAAATALSNIGEQRGLMRLLREG